MTKRVINAKMWARMFETEGKKKKKRKEKLMQKPGDWNEFDDSSTREKSNVTSTVAIKGSC